MREHECLCLAKRQYNFPSSEVVKQECAWMNDVVIYCTLFNFLHIKTNYVFSM